MRIKKERSLELNTYETNDWLVARYRQDEKTLEDIANLPSAFDPAFHGHHLAPIGSACAESSEWGKLKRQSSKRRGIIAFPLNLAPTASHQLGPLPQRRTLSV
jgi:hypothetical protein